jgi:hypothetical protein
MSCGETISATAQLLRQADTTSAITHKIRVVCGQLPPCWNHTYFACCRMLPVVTSIRQRCAHKSDANSCSAFEMREFGAEVCSAHATDLAPAEGGRCTEPCAVFMTGAATGLCLRLLNSMCQRARRWRRDCCLSGTWKSCLLQCGTFRKSPATGSFFAVDVVAQPLRLMLHPRPWLLLSLFSSSKFSTRDSIQYGN